MNNVKVCIFWGMSLRIFQKNRKPSIHSIQLDHFGWEQVESTAVQKIWVNEHQSVLVALSFFAKPPDLFAPLDDIDALRRGYRQRIVELVNGGLIKCEITTWKELNMLEMVVKFPREPSGMNYVGSFTIPFKECSYVVKVQASEIGLTGIREAILLDRWMAEHGEPAVDAEGHWVGMHADPYDGSFQGGNLMSFAEAEQYDSEFPQHPLSQVRARMPLVRESLEFGKELYALEPYGKA